MASVLALGLLALFSAQDALGLVLATQRPFPSAPLAESGAIAHRVVVPDLCPDGAGVRYGVPCAIALWLILNPAGPILGIPPWLPNLLLVLSVPLRPLD